MIKVGRRPRGLDLHMSRGVGWWSMNLILWGVSTRVWGVIKNKPPRSGLLGIWFPVHTQEKTTTSTALFIFASRTETNTATLHHADQQWVSPNTVLYFSYIRPMTYGVTVFLYLFLMKKCVIRYFNRCTGKCVPSSRPTTVYVYNPALLIIKVELLLLLLLLLICRPRR